MSPSASGIPRVQSSEQADGSLLARHSNQNRGGRAAWADCQASLQEACQCDAGMGQGRWVCDLCGGFRVPLNRAAGAANVGFCPWCNVQVARRCVACLRGIHYVGECHRWTCGADQVFGPDASLAQWLCPDCNWEFALRLADATRRPQAGQAPSVLQQHMLQAARLVLPGAGHGLLRATARRGLHRQAKAWILSYLRGLSMLAVRPWPNRGAA